MLHNLQMRKVRHNNFNFNRSCSSDKDKSNSIECQNDTSSQNYSENPEKGKKAVLSKNHSPQGVGMMTMIIAKLKKILIEKRKQ